MAKFNSEQNKEFWNEYARKSKDNPFGAHTDKQVVELENQFIISELKSKRFTSLLDIGCGNGQRTLLFQRYVSGKLLGIDYSPVMIEEANTLLSKQDETIRNGLSFEVADIHNFSKNMRFDVIISCRCLINQPSHEDQIKLFEILHNKLNPGGSLIIAEVSKDGMERLNALRNKHGLGHIETKWHNLHVDETIVFPKIRDLFDIKMIKRLGVFYYITRVLHPSLVYPDAPDPNAKINDLGKNSEIILQNELGTTENSFERFGIQLLVHFIKK